MDSVKQEIQKPLTIKKSFRKFILERDHPCLMAQTVFKMDQVKIKGYTDFGTETAAHSILSDLEDYLGYYNFEDNHFFTFIAAFPLQENMDEVEFESVLWEQLQYLHNADKKSWDSSVSSNPASENFSFSLLNNSFYIIGMHPNSSRKARQSPHTCLVFNLHWQFEKLREMGVYDQMRDRIRKRERKMNGSINPMVKNFGVQSEARQYSGREVGESWECPFQHKSHA